MAAAQPLGGSGGPPPRKDAALALLSAGAGMMDAVADQHQDDDQRPDTPGTEIEPAPPAQPAAADPPALPADPEELRRFREFQQFQEFQRFQDFQRAELERREDPPPPAKRKPPKWLVTIGGKILGALLLLAAIVLGGALAIDYFLGAEDPITPEEQAKQGGKKAEGTKLFASSPYEAVRRIYDDVAQGVTDDICLRFDEAARGQFAANMGHETCSAAAADLHEQVTNVDAYAESLPSNVSNPGLGDQIDIDSCAVAVAPSGVRGGPALGTFTVTKLPEAEGRQWLITGHIAGPEKCPVKSP